MIIQLALWLIGVIALLITWRRYMQRAIRLPEALFVSLVWIAGMIVVALPALATRFAAFVGVGRGVDAIVYVAVAALCVIAFQQHVALRRFEQRFSKLVEALALDEWRRK